MRARLVATVRLVALIALEVATVPLLRGGGGAGAPASIDWGHLGRWLSTADPEDAVTAVVRVGAMVLATWLLATTVLYLVAKLTRVPGLVRGVEWFTLPVVRKVVDAAVAASVVGGAVLGAHPAGAQVPAPTPIVVELNSTTTTSVPVHLYVPVPAGESAAASSATPGPSSTVGTTAAPPTTAKATSATATTQVPASPGVARSTAAPVEAARADDPASHLHTVVPGDNLWSISEAELSRQTGRTPDHLAEAEVRNYWVKVMDANRSRLRSGDLNLIYPGESVVCPPAAG